MFRIFKGGYSFNKIRQFSFVVEYIYLSFLCILIIRRYPPHGMDFGLYLPLIMNISIALLYSIVLYRSGDKKEPALYELVITGLYLFIAAKLMAETGNPSIQIIITMPTVIMALRYPIKYTLITAFMTSSLIIINLLIYRQFQFDYIFILISFIWVIGLLVNSSMEVERQMQRERLILQEREKLAAIGQMAAGIAHEVRNPLTTIKGIVQLLYKYSFTKDITQHKSYLMMIDKKIDRMNELLKNLLQFAKPVKPKLALNNINDTIGEIGALLESHCAGKHIEIEMNLYPDMPSILCDHDQIKQVIINIALNAVDAMQDSDVKMLRFVTSYNQNSVSVVIKDTGSGMTIEQTRKIFDPFYTTKDSGTGLGLSVCHSIIANHQGRIEVNSKLDEGTAFMIVIPRFS